MRAILALHKQKIVDTSDKVSREIHETRSEIPGGKSRPDARRDRVAPAGKMRRSLSTGGGMSDAIIAARGDGAEEDAAKRACKTRNVRRRDYSH